MFVFMALFPPLQTLPPPFLPPPSAVTTAATQRASRESLSRVPLFLFLLSISSPPPHPRPDLLLYVPLPPSFRETHVGSVLTSSPRLIVARLRTLFPSPHVLSFVIPTRSLDSGRKGGPTTRRARTAGRDRPHRRGHHFNVTLIKSNNQYLPRKKF